MPDHRIRAKRIQQRRKLQSAVVELYGENIPFDEIAARLGISEKYVELLHDRFVQELVEIDLACVFGDLTENDLERSADMVWSLPA